MRTVNPSAYAYAGSNPAPATAPATCHRGQTLFLLMQLSPRLGALSRMLTPSRIVISHTGLPAARSCRAFASRAPVSSVEASWKLFSRYRTSRLVNYPV